jgi:hypothetical protein
MASDSSALRQFDILSAMNKFKTQLGMAYSTARSKLFSDVLFSFINRLKIVCYHCKKEMTREDFSIEHIKPWHREPNALDLFFDLNNIGFSHGECNARAARKREIKRIFTHGTYIGYAHYKCKCFKCADAWRAYKRARYTSEDRAAKYKRRGT